MLSNVSHWKKSSVVGVHVQSSMHLMSGRKGVPKYSIYAQYPENEKSRKK
jgi:hypothetical protein